MRGELCRNEVMKAMEDAQIIALFQKRSEDAIVQVRKKYGRICMRLLHNMLQNEQDAQECANDVYLALWNTIPPENPDPLVTYLLKIARNQGLRRITYENAQRRGGHKAVAFEELEICLASATNPEQLLERKQLEESVERFLRKLPKGDRQLFLRRYWFGDSVEEMASTFGWTQGKIKSRLFRMRNRLRNHLVKEGYLNE